MTGAVLIVGKRAQAKPLGETGFDEEVAHDRCRLLAGLCGPRDHHCLGIPGSMSNLDVYLALKVLDVTYVERLRDVLDRVWHSLTHEEQEYLAERE